MTTRMNATRWNGPKAPRLLLLLLALAFLSGGCRDQLLPPEPGEAPPPSTLRIYYVDTIGAWMGTTSIWTLRGDGGDLRRVAEGVLGYAPRGDMIAYMAYSGAQGTTGIYTAAADGTGAVLRIPGAPNDRQMLSSLALGPDGTIASLSQDFSDTGGPSTWLDLDGPAGARSVRLGIGYLSTEYTPGPIFSPDGRTIAVATLFDFSSTGTLLTVDVATGSVDSLAMVEALLSPDCFTWSPDGRRVAYVTSDGTTTWLVAVDRTTRRRDTIYESTSMCVSPRWHPDGTQIAMIRISEGGADVFTVSLDGSIRRITNTPLAIEYMLDIAPDGSALLIGALDPFGNKDGVVLSVLDLRSTLSQRRVASAVQQAMWGR